MPARRCAVPGSGSVTLALVMEPAAFSCLFRHIDPHGHKSQSERAMTRRALGGASPGAPGAHLPHWLAYTAAPAAPTPRKTQPHPEPRPWELPQATHCTRDPSTRWAVLFRVAPLGLPRSQSHAARSCSFEGSLSDCVMGAKPFTS